MTSIIQAHTEYPSKRLRFIAIQYLLDNPEIERELPSVISEQIEPIKEKLSQHLDISIRQHIEIIRNQYIDRLLDGVVEYPNEEQQFLTEKLDKIIMNRYLGIPIFLVIMWLIFQTTFTWIGTPLSISSMLSLADRSQTG